MAKKEDNFDDINFSGVEELDNFDDIDFSGAEEVPMESDMSQLEAAALSGGSGLTLGFLDELIGMFKASGGASPMQTIQDPKKAIEKERALGKSYIEESEKAQQRLDKAREEYPITSTVSELAGGVIPALMGGFGASVAKVGTSLGKGAPAATKAILKTVPEGLKYGAAYNLGESRAEDVQGMLKDTATGALTGGLSAPVTALGLKGAGKAYSSGKKAVKDVLDRFETLSVPFKHAAKHGLTSKSSRSVIVEKQVKDLLKNIKKEFKELNLSNDIYDKMKERIDITGDLSLLADDLMSQSKFLTGSAGKKLRQFAKEAETLAKGSRKAAEKELQEATEKEIQKKLEASARKGKKAITDSESSLVQQAVKSGDELEMIAEKQLGFEDVSDIKYDTKDGEIFKSRGRFTREVPDPETGEMVKQSYDKILTKDVTKFQPSPIEIAEEGGELVAKYANEATGEVFTKRTGLPPEMLDFKNMSMDDLIKWVDVVGKKAWDEADPEKELYKELWKIGRNKISELRPKLSQTKQERYKLMEVMKILGIDKDNMYANVSPSDMVKMIKGIPSKMDVEKDYIQRNLLKEGSDVAKSMEDIGLTTKMGKVMEGSVSDRGDFTKAGMMQRSFGTGSEIAGSLYGNVSRLIGKPIEAATSTSNRLLKKLSPQQLGKLRDSMINKGKSGQIFANDLDKIINASEPEMVDQAIFTLSQNPGFRKILGNFIKSMGSDVSDYFGIEKNPLDDLLGKYNSQKQDNTLPEDSDNLREPASVEEDDSVEMESGLPDRNNLPKSMFSEDLDKYFSESIPKVEQPFKKINTTEVNENLEGYSSSSYRPEVELGAINGFVTGADKEPGHGAKNPKYINPTTGEIVKYKNKYNPNYVDKKTGKKGRYEGINIGLDYGPSVDLDKTKEGTQYNPMFGGEVVLSGMDQHSKGHGESIIIKNDFPVTIDGIEYDVYAAYGHNDEILVDSGRVDEDTPIATMGGSYYDKNMNFQKNRYDPHVDVRTFLVPKDEDWDVKDKLYINPKQLERLMLEQQPEPVSNVFEDGGVAVNEVEKNIAREKKQLGSGASAGTDRSTLDDLMGSLRKLKGVNESDMDELESSAMAGDMRGLQELLDRLKGM